MNATNALPSPNFDLLLSQLCAGDLPPAQAAELTAQLEGSDRARETYIRYMNLHAELMWRFCEGRAAAESVQRGLAHFAVPGEQNVRVPFVPPRNPRSPLFIRLTALAASMLLVAYFVGMVVYVSMRNEKPSSDQVATIVSTQDAQWVGTEAGSQESGVANQKSEITNQKSEITPGTPLEIASGVVQLKLKQGATLLVQGPAQWSIDGDNRATLRSGKAHAVVPPQAAGFLLKTPAAEIVDLGTEFTAEAKSASETTLQVIRGEVRIDDTKQSTASQRVTAGQAVRIQVAANGDPRVEKIPFDAAQASIPQIARAPLEPWQKMGQKLLQDPSLVAYYDFEDHAHPSLPTDAKARQGLLINARADKLHGQVISPTRPSSWTTGRWHEKRALALGPNFASALVPDDPALNLDGQGTIAAWVRPDAKHWRRHMPIVIKGGLQNGYSLWLASDCRIRFLAVGADGKANKFDSQSPVALNRWHLITVTMASGGVRLYLDGTLSREGRFAGTFAANNEPLRLAPPAEDRAWPTFVGVMDEVTLFNRAQSPEEIAAMYEAGKPD